MGLKFFLLKTVSQWSKLCLYPHKSDIVNRQIWVWDSEYVIIFDLRIGYVILHMSSAKFFIKKS